MMGGTGSSQGFASLEVHGRIPSRNWLALWGAVLALPLMAAPKWKAPTQLKLGELQVLELREDDPSQPAPARPVVEDRLGSLRLRSLEPLPDGRGWRFQVQALEPGPVLVPALELGAGQHGPELRLEVPRTIPYGGPWVGFGGGNEDRLPPMPFPWAWASLLLLPPFALIAWAVRHWQRGSSTRRLKQMAERFRTHWPPADRSRASLDAVHDLGRDLLAARFGDQARAWGPADFHGRSMAAWVQWVQSLDAARFGHTEPPFPPSGVLLASLNARSGPEAKP